MSATFPPQSTAGPFSTEQKEYLQGFLAGALTTGPAVFAGHTPAGLLTATPSSAHSGNLAAPPSEETIFGTPLSDLCKEERWKYEEDPLDAWERLVKHAENDTFPDPEHTYRFKTFGLFYVAPAQDSFMIRLRVPACELSAHQLHGLADLVSDLGGGYAHITTRGNLQIREFKPRDLVKVLVRVQDLGLTSRGSGADNIRNITASPDSGFASEELLDVRPYAKALHHYILNHRDLYGLPRKFNVAFDNGGRLSVAADTNDIAFIATRLAASPETGDSLIRFRVQLGGITGHGDFARDTGLCIRPAEAVAVAAAMIRVFAEHGDRTNRKKARLKYLLDAWGIERFLDETQRKLAFPLTRLPLTACEPRPPVEKHAWLGVHRQTERGRNWIGVGIPVGRMSARQMHALADLATHYGKGELRLTVWQNLLIPHLPDAFVETVKRSIHRMGFYTETSLAAGGIIACTGNKGCKYSSADTKGHATALYKALVERFPELNSPVNIHVTGCAHSCAQHYCGDIGLVSTKISDGSEGYHLVVGGGMDHEQGIGRELLRGLRASELNTTITKLLTDYLRRRNGSETYVQWTRRHSVKELQEFFST